MSAAKPARKPAPDRRAVLGGSLALASVVVATAAPVRAEAAPHPDAELLSLALQIEATRARLDEVAAQSDDAYEHRFQEPPHPEAALWRPSDYRTAGLLETRLDSGLVDGVTRYFYTTQGVLADLRGELAQQEARGVLNSFYGAERVDRLREIITVGEAWEVERDAAWEAAGLGDLDRAYDEERERQEALARRIVTIPAHTLDGICAKVRAITIAGSWNVAALEHTVLPRRIVEDDADDAAEMLLMSAMIDAAKLSSPKPASIEASA